MPMKTVSKAKLKAQMLALFREVEKTGVPLVVTDHGRPVLQVTPIASPPQGFDESFAPYRAKFRDNGDSLLAPTTDEWSEV